MDVFSLRESLVDQYAGFARSFTRIRAGDIREQVTAAYESARFWPDPLIQINPRFKPGRRVADLVADGTLHPTCARLFGDIPSLHRHQEYAIALAARRQSVSRRKCVPEDRRNELVIAACRRCLAPRNFRVEVDSPITLVEKR